MDTERLDRLDSMIRENRLLRGAWSQGHERACLLAALSPEAGAAESAEACPAEVMPPWLASLTPWIDDAPSQEAWPQVIRRYAALAHRWHCLDAAAWERARIGALIAILSEARTHVAPEHTAALAAIDSVLAWLGRGAPEADEREAVREAAAAAAEAAAEAAAWAARSARAAARAAAEARSAYAARSAEAAAEAAAWAARSAAADAAAYAARSAYAAAYAAAEAAARWAVLAAAKAAAGATAEAAAWAEAAACAAAADRMASSTLDAIEREIEAAEAAA